MKSDEIAIILPVFNEELYIERCLSSLEKSGFSKVYIDDANSSDNTLNLIRNHKSSLKINLTTNSFQLSGFGSVKKILKRINSKWIFFMGADDLINDYPFLDIKSNERKLKNNQLYFPLIQRWSEKNNKEINIYPPQLWIDRVNKSKYNSELVSNAIDFASADILCLLVLPTTQVKWVYRNLKIDCMEGINFWIILTVLINIGPSVNVLISKKPILKKVYDKEFLTGTHHPDHKNKGKLPISKKILRRINSIFNILIFSIKYRLTPKSILMLLFKPRGKLSSDFGYTAAPLGIK